MRASRVFASVALFASLLVAIEFNSSAAAPAASSAPAVNADTLYARQDWPAALRAHQAITKRDPGLPRAWYRFGVCYAAMQRWRDAIAADHRVDDRGSLTNYTNGQYKHGAMVYLAEQKGPEGKPVRLRMSFFNLAPGQVRQLGEQSTDDGVAWVTTFDRNYVRRKWAFTGLNVRSVQNQFVNCSNNAPRRTPRSSGSDVRGWPRADG